ncbi:MAG: hypothetical protein IT497_00710 [Ottowia sp.]|nr:hypothetical protein [Ottowia sp.]
MKLPLLTPQKTQSIPVNRHTVSYGLDSSFKKLANSVEKMASYGDKIQQTNDRVGKIAARYQIQTNNLSKIKNALSDLKKQNLAQGKSLWEKMNFNEGTLDEVKKYKELSKSYKTISKNLKIVQNYEKKIDKYTQKFNQYLNKTTNIAERINPSFPDSIGER